MSDVKGSAPAERAASDNSHEEVHSLDLPNSWMYRRLGKKLPYYASPEVQLVLVSFVCFLCPGMFNALSGMGGGGQVDKHAANGANTALYATFAVVGFSAGSICNRIGIKTTLCLGGLGYSLYVGSFLCYNHTANYGFTVAAGAILGVCAGLLWTAQGAIMMSYPAEKQKGKFISWFWMIFNLGAVLGGLIPLGLNFHTTEAAPVNDGTYIGFLILTFLGACLAWSLVDARSVIRTDGSKVIMMKNPTWTSEILGMFQTFGTDPYIIFLFPMFFSSNWFYTYQFNSINGTKFNTRTRALNSVLYYMAQIFGAYIFGYGLDLKRFSRPTRAKGAWAVIFCFTMVMWGVGYIWQKGYTREDPGIIYDWSTSGYVGPMFLYMFYGAYDAAWQTTVYWLMGSMTNNGRKLANFAGFYKGIQSAGAAVTWGLDNVPISFMAEWASCWALLAGSLVIALPTLLLKIKDHTDVEEDLAFTDETLADIHVKNDMEPYYEEKV